MTRRLTALAAAAAAAFHERTGAQPEVLWAAPGRVNLIGEHTDYSDGFVLPVAIDRWTVVAAARRGDGMLRCWSTRGPQPGVDGSAEPGLPAAATVEVAAIRPGGLSGGVAYVAGTAWALARHGVPVGGADLVVHGDLPVGAGLASSAALTCAAVGALAQLAAVTLPPETVARLARQAEVEIVGMPCGVMDQLACTLGRAGHALFLDTRTLEPTLIPLDLEASGLRLLVIDTRAEHKLVEDAYAQRRADTQEAAWRLGVAALRDTTPAAVEAAAAALGPRLTHRARHVTTENVRVLEALALLRAHHPERLGPLMAASHASLRDDFEVSCRELDVAVAAAVGTGAAGARMTGAGFGGSAIALVPTGQTAEMAAAVRAAFAAEDLRVPEVIEVQAADGAGPMR